MGVFSLLGPKRLAMMTDGPNGSCDPDSRSWASSTGVPAPSPGNVIIVGDTLPVAMALSEAQGGRYLLYLGRYANARRLLAAMGRRLAAYHSTVRRASTPAEAFHKEREAKQTKHYLLSRLVVLLIGPDYRPLLNGAAPLGDFGGQVWGPIGARALMVPMREWVGAIGAREWYRRGVEVPSLGASVHPHYGVFAPVRSEYVELVADQADQTIWPAGSPSMSAPGLGSSLSLWHVIAPGSSRRTRTSGRSNAHERTPDAWALIARSKCGKSSPTPRSLRARPTSWSVIPPGYPSRSPRGLTGRSTTPETASSFGSWKASEDT